MKQYDGKQHRISLTEAQRFINNYESEAEFSGVAGGLFDKQCVLDVLNQDDCIGLRYYFGKDDSGKVVLIMLGVNELGRDISDGIIIERAYPCPPYCDEASILREQNQKVSI